MERMYYLCCMVLLWVPGVYVAVAPSRLSPPVETVSGPVVGEVVPSSPLTPGYTRYLGIPYAAPPLGELRFSAPTPHPGWSRPLQAVRPGYRCMQPIDPDPTLPDLNEDCLTLNVYVPESNITEKRAVMVNFHAGGLFLWSSADDPIDGMAIAGDVIAVSVNYRLGVFGFFASDDPATPANLGFLDQILALRWIRKNIGLFGGDPDQVTLYGVSAGGWSASVHLVSPLSAGLFNRAIIQGGAIFGWHPESRSERTKKSRDLGETLGCSGTELMKCIRSLPASDILDMAVKVKYFPMGGFVVGDMVLPASPTHLLMTSGPHPGVRVLMGGTDEEGTLGMYHYKGDKVEVVRDGTAPGETFYEAFLEAISDTFPPRLDSIRGRLLNYITDMYETGSPNRIHNLRGLLDAHADRMFVAPLAGQARALAKPGNPVYLYQFSHKPKVILHPGIPHLYTEADPKLKLRAAHGTDWIYSCARGLYPDIPGSYFYSMTSDDVMLSRSIVNAWISFAKSGVPVYKDSVGEEVEWPPYTDPLDSERYLSITATPSMEKGLRPHRVEQWNFHIADMIEAFETGRKDEL